MAGIAGMNIDRIIQFIEPEMRQVEQYIQGQLAAPIQVVTDIFQHTVGAGGKRLRPAMCLLSAASVGEINHDVITLGGDVELIHTVTLIHDDIVDEAETRRGKPAANTVWGNELSVLVGDYMFSKVFLSLTRNGCHQWTPLLAETTTKLSTGELLEIEYRGKMTLTEEEYLLMIQFKTAELTATACQVGGMAAGASQPEMDALRAFGLNLGMAFQITDDVLDIVADNTSLGKPVGKDLREGKITLPLIHALRTATERLREEIVQLARKSECTPSEIDRILSFIIQQEGVQYSRQVARQYADRAQTSIGSLKPSPARDALVQITDFVVERNK